MSVLSAGSNNEVQEELERSRLKIMDTKKMMITGASFWPVGITVMVYAASPNAFFGNPISQIVFATTTAWLVVGFIVMLKFNRVWQVLLAQVPFTLPVAMVAVLVPAIITIVSAIR